MGGGFDARIMGYLELDYTKFTECVLTGNSDAECWDYCVKNDPEPNDLPTLAWNDFASERGWSDSGSEPLKKFKDESGFADREDIQTFFEYMEVDEGRKV